MARFEFITAGRILLGPGTSADLPGLLGSLGRRAALVVSAGSMERGGAPADLAARLEESGCVALRIAAHGEPDIAGAEAAAEQARAAGCDCAVAIGGGSVIDTAKALAALAANPGGALEHLETVGAGRPLDHPALPVVALPTTAGAGSEATRNTVLRAPQQGAKASIRDASLMPRIAIVDPDLARDLPAAVVAACGMDALTQLIEAFVSRRAGPLTDGLCREGLWLAGPALRRAAAGQYDDEARIALATAALLSGMALANAGLGAVHGVAAPLGGSFSAPHGAICAALLAPVTAANLGALRSRDPRGPALERYAEVAELLGARRDAGALPDMLRDLTAALRIPGLAAYGVTPADIPGLAERAMQASSTRSNPVALEPGELSDAIAGALD
jgi:alcohol dehydrogenase class IV